MMNLTRRCSLIRDLKTKYIFNAISSSNRNQSSAAAVSPTDASKIGSRGVYRDSFRQIEPRYNNLSYAMSDAHGLHLLCDTFSHRIDAMARNKPNDVGYTFCLTRQQFTFLEIKQRIDEIAQNLLNLGFQKGDRLAVFLPNIPENALTLLAASSIGLIVVLMNPAYQLVEVEHMLKKTRAKGIVMLDNLKTLQHYDMLKKICPELETSQKGELNSKNLPNLKHVIIANNRLFRDPNQQTKGCWNFSELEKFNMQFKERPQVDMDDSMLILFTVS